MIEPTKPSLRRHLLTVRRALSSADRSLANRKITEFAVQRLAEWLGDSHENAVFVYISRADEVATNVIIDHCTAHDRPVVVPHVTSNTMMQAVEFSGWAHLAEGALGILSPREVLSTTRKVTIAFIPGLGFTREGCRLGFGKGYYDRWLNAHPQALRVGLAFQAQIVDWLPTEAHDIALDYLITDQCVYPFQPNRVRDLGYN